MNKKRLSSTAIILSGFLIVILIGSILLALPISHAHDVSISYIDALFTATTSTCVTGLVTVPTVSSWSIFGQIVILILIQIGGLGVITIITVAMLLAGKHLGLSDRIIIQDAFNLNTLSGMIIFVRKVIKYTLFIEGCGALAYMFIFIPEFGLRGIWISIFNSISAFCNAGLDIISPDSLYNYRFNIPVNIITSLLIIMGGLGFIVYLDIFKVLKDYKEKKHFFKRLTLHSKIVLTSTFILIFGGALLFFVFEYHNPLTMQDYSLPQRITVSLFESITTRTAGFATIPQKDLTNASSLLALILMFIGGSPVGTAGGIKTVTIVILLLTSIAVVKNRNDVSLFNRRLSDTAIRKAMAVTTFSFFTAFISSMLLSCVIHTSLLDILFETISATATVGLSRDLTSTLPLIGKLIIIVTMYFGRIGPISIAVAFYKKDKKDNLIRNPIEEISVG